MNTTSLIKITTTAVSSLLTAAFVTSCVQPQQQVQQPVQGQVAQQGSNPYAVPGLGQGQAPVAPQPPVVNNGSAPYQPLPGVPSDPPTVNIPDPTPNVNYTPSAPSASASTHDVIKGESLWRISRKYGVSIEAIQQANGLKNNNIWAGQKLIIPSAN